MFLAQVVHCCSSSTLHKNKTWELKLRYNNFLLSINTIQEIKKSPHTNTNANEWWWWWNFPSVFQMGSQHHEVWVFENDILHIIYGFQNSFISSLDNQNIVFWENKIHEIFILILHLLFQIFIIRNQTMEVLAVLLVSRMKVEGEWWMSQLGKMSELDSVSTWQN